MIQVDLVEGSRISQSGIGRYSRLVKELTYGKVSVNSVYTKTIPPVFGRFTFLEHLPLRVDSTPDVQITHFPRIMGCSIALWQSFTTTVATVHDLGMLVCQADRELWNYFDINILKLQLAGLKRIDYFMVNSEQTRKHLRDLLGICDERIFTVTLGVDLELFQRRSASKTFIQNAYKIPPSDALDIVYVGNEFPRKNIKTLLGAVAATRKRGVPIRLIKVGGAGGERWRAQTIELLKQYQVSDHVIFTGYVPDEHLAYFYSAGDVYITTTLLEGGFNWPCMEALACGMPVVASKEALIPDAIGGAAFISAENTPECFSDLLIKCYFQRDSLSQRGEQAAKMMRSYSQALTAAQLLSVYRQITQL